MCFKIASIQNFYEKFKFLMLNTNLKKHKLSNYYIVIELFRVFIISNVVIYVANPMIV